MAEKGEVDAKSVWSNTPEQREQLFRNFIDEMMKMSPFARVGFSKLLLRGTSYEVRPK